jgi:O-antigen/teichoic acid export membrane protein
MARSTARLLVSGSALRAGNLVAQVMVGFFLTPFVVHSLGDRMYGFWALVGTFIGYYGLLELGLGSAVSRYVGGALGKGDKEECGKLFSTALQLYVVLGLAVIAITVVLSFASPLFVRNPQDASLFGKVILILGLSIGLGFPARAFGGILNAELRLDWLAVIGLATLLLRTALVVAVLLAGCKVLALAWVAFISGLPGIAASAVLARKQCPWLRFSAQPWLGQRARALLSYGAFALVAHVADQLRSGVDEFVIAGCVGLAAVTHFRIASLLAGYFANLMMALVGTIQPWFSRMDGTGDQHAIQRALLFSTKLSICAAAFAAFGFVALGKPFIERWMGRPYLDAYPCLAILALGYVAAFGQGPSRYLLYGISKHKFFAVINTIEGVANVGLSIWFVRTMGIFGVALGTFIPMVVVKLIAQPLYVCRVSLIPYGVYVRELAKSLLIVCASLIVPGLISVRFAAANYYSLAAVALASLVCYAAVIRFLQFNGQEWEMLRRAVLPSSRAAVYQNALSAGEVH